MRLNRLRKVLFDPLYWKLSRREILRHLEEEGLGEIVAATAQYRGWGFYKSIRAYQALWEVIELSRLVQTTKPRTIVEIGTYRGGTLWIWCRSNKTAGQSNYHPDLERQLKRHRGRNRTCRF